MANKSSGNSKTAQAAAYQSKSKWATNRKLKLERALKKNPNNQQIVAALNNIVYRRKTPKTNVWSHTMIREAKLIKAYTGKADPNIWSSNDKTAGMALSGSHNPNKVFPKHNYPVSFTLGARAHNGAGTLVWG